ITLLGLMYGFQVIGERHGRQLIVGICIEVAAVSMWLFVHQEKRATDPINDLKLFSNRTFVIQTGVAATVSGFLICFNVYIPTWTQGLLGLPAAQAGFAVTPSSVMWIVGSFIAGRLIGKRRPQQILLMSLTIVLVGAVILVLIPGNTPFWAFLLISAELGVGFGLTITSTTVTSQHLVNPAIIGMATSFNTLARSLAQTIMLAIYGIVMNATLAEGVARHSQIKLGMLNALINPQTAQKLPIHLLPTLRNVLASGVHNVFLAALGLVIIALGINTFDKRQTN
ncbi:MAG TPA: MFS transporter, partial [Lactobacillus sp.]|nr:MFS transporter [Lactobacillus sp.]